MDLLEFYDKCRDDKILVNACRLLLGGLFDKNESIIHLTVDNRECAEQLTYAQTAMDVIEKEYANVGSLDLNINDSGHPIYMVIFMSKNDGVINEKLIKINVLRWIMSSLVPGIDEHLQDLAKRQLVNVHNIAVDKYGLTDMVGDRFHLKKHGFALDGVTLLYPHQFLRRYYSSNFVDINLLLYKAIKKSLKVSVRIDPNRETTLEYYKNITELDYWHGKPLSDDLLSDTSFVGSTLHWTPEHKLLRELTYPVGYTVFRTSFISKGVRQFMIEEYCPVEVGSSGKTAPGVGKRSVIQKFGHFTYDQKQKAITHLDCSVREFDKDEYLKIYNSVSSGVIPGDKIGTRHKMLLVEGVLDKELAMGIITEFFRYNEHIGEYFATSDTD